MVVTTSQAMNRPMRIQVLKLVSRNSINARFCSERTPNQLNVQYTVHNSASTCCNMIGWPKWFGCKIDRHFILSDPHTIHLQCQSTSIWKSLWIYYCMLRAFGNITTPPSSRNVEKTISENDFQKTYFSLNLKLAQSMEDIRWRTGIGYIPGHFTHVFYFSSIRIGKL